jgi:hypothetical protein
LSWPWCPRPELPKRPADHDGLGAADGDRQRDHPVAYAITQTDRDTNTSNQQFTDTTCVMLILAIRSIQPGTGVFTLRGVSQDGTYTWEVSGTAVTVPGTYVDDWQLGNYRMEGDVYRDPSLVVQQRVKVQGMSYP